MPFGTEADMQGTLTMLFKTWMTGGNPPLFMDFRKVWEPFELLALAKELGVTPWQARPKFIEGVDRPEPLMHLINGGEKEAKRLRAR